MTDGAEDVNVLPANKVVIQMSHRTPHSSYHRREQQALRHRVKDCVRNLIGHLIGVTFRDGFRGEEIVVSHLVELL